MSNAAETHAEYRCRIADLGDVNWTAVSALQWSGDLKAPKQAEFLVHRHVPWSLIERVGVMSQHVANRVSEIVGGTAGVRVDVCPTWYY